MKNQTEVFALVTAEGKMGSKKNVLAIEKTGEGKYLIKFPADRFVRPQTHKINFTVLGTERRTVQLANETGGNQIEVHSFCGNDHKDASFVFDAERR